MKDTTERVMPALSKRLSTIADMIEDGAVLCDVGCDHARVPLRLIEDHRIMHALAMDVVKGPLEAAAENIRYFGYEKEITLRQSDGLSSFTPGEADSLVIAGMGGILISEILSRYPDKIASFTTIVVEPQSEHALVRRTLRDLGFSIVCERMVYEDGKYYPIIKSAPVGATEEATSLGSLSQDTIDTYGPLLLETKDEVLCQYLHYLLSVRNKILNRMDLALREKDANKNGGAVTAQDAGVAILQKKRDVILEEREEIFTVLRVIYGEER